MKRRLKVDKLVVGLALVILLIFGVDYLRRCVMGLFVDQPDISVSHPGASTGESADSKTDDTSPDSSPDSANDNSAADSSAGYNAEKFQTLSKAQAELGIGPLVLINKEHPYTAPGTLAGFQGVKNDFFRLKSFDVQVNEALLTPLNDLFAAFHTATGLKNIMLYTTHLTYAAGIYKEDVPERASGYSVDLALLADTGGIARFTGEGNYKKLLETAPTFGFVQRYPAGKEDKTGMEAEPWHLRYVSPPHAMLMQQQGLCLEEYIEYLKDFTVDGSHASVSVGTKYYEIYYVAANSTGSTEVPVPKTGVYTVSGNNADGFVVTMEVALA